MFINEEAFWNEVELLARNNYGVWVSEREAQNRIAWAIKDLLNNIGDNLDYSKSEEIAKRMV